MKTTIKIITTIIVLIQFTLVRAQQQPNYSQNKQAQMFFNPAHIATEEGITARLLGRWQWVGFDGAPTTYSAGFEYGLPQKNLGLGLGLINDETAEFRNTSIQIYSAYKLQVSKTGSLSMGLTGSINTISQKLTETFVLEQENLFSTDLQETNANFGVGFHFQEKNWWAGVSMPYILNQSFEDNTVKFFDQRRHYYLQGGYRFSVSPKVDLEPTVLTKLVSGGIPDFNVTTIAWYDDKIGGGIGYRNQESVNFILQTKVNDGLMIGYAVDMIVDKDLSQLANSSHEVALVFRSLGATKNKDTDGDGVKDKEDECPETFGPASNNGCPYPDTDGDGVIDKNDDCPGLAGSPELGGCPDSDGDGIKDSEDSCPNEKGSARNNGCPDSDGDGIIDAEDKCPNVAGLEQFGGCPDTDGDGVQDKLDKCPDVKGTLENLGCPEVSEASKEVLSAAVSGVQFQSGKDILTSESSKVLDRVVEVMVNNPSYKLEISGYTDSSGDDQKNLELSRKRAKSVLEYLVEKGISRERLFSEGFGEVNPVADNSTAAGRAKNRRVEFELKLK